MSAIYGYLRRTIIRPLRQQDEPQYKRFAPYLLIAIVFASFSLFSYIGSFAALASFPVLLFIVSAVIADISAVDVRGATASMIDLMWVVGFAVLPVEQAAMVGLFSVVGSTLIDVNCRNSWYTTLRHASMLLVSAPLALGGAILGRELAHGLGTEAILFSVITSLVAVRFFDYFVFHVLDKFIYGVGFARGIHYWKSYYRIDLIQTSIVLPAAISLAYAYRYVPYLVLFSTIPCIVVWLLGRTEKELTRTESRVLELQRLMDIDETTGLMNRDFLLDTMVREVASATRYGQRLHLIALKVELPSGIETEQISAISKGAANALQKAARRASDIIGLYGQGVFVALSSCAEHEDGSGFDEKLRSAVARSVERNGATVLAASTSFDPSNDDALVNREIGEDDRLLSQYEALGSSYMRASRVLQCLLERAIPGSQKDIVMTTSTPTAMRGAI